MNDAPPESTPGTPKPIVKRMRWPFPVIWIVPIVAAILAGYYLYEHHKERGPEITIEFADGSGMTPDQTNVQMHGVQVGQVKSVVLSDNHSHAVVHVRLKSEYEFLAKQDTIFWVVRPELSLQSVSGLNALVTGPYIETRPGAGAKTTEFTGLKSPPIADRPGMKVLLRAETLGDVTLSSPVTYRGVQVGVVADIRLSEMSDSANVTIYIWEPYTPLVRSTSAFWMLKGADVKGGIFSGVKVKLDSLRTLLTGGITFSTPGKDLGEAVKENATFFLNETPKDAWLNWKPRIHIPSEDASMDSRPIAPEAGVSELPAPKQAKH